MPGMESNYGVSGELLRPLVQGWIGKITGALRSRQRKAWKAAVDDCELFFSGNPWEGAALKTWWKDGGAPPRFKILIAKAFELVALFGPSLFYNVPHRKVEAKRPDDLPLEAFGDPNDPATAPMLQAVQQEMQQGAMEDGIVSRLLESWLNYTPRESPGGGLERHARMAITDALKTGRGCLWTRPYRMPGSDKLLTGCFYEKSTNLVVDSDFDTLQEAKWIARKVVAPYWEVERKFGLKNDSLKGKATLESASSFGERAGDEWAQDKRNKGDTNDLLVYYEIWSKMGCGAKLAGMKAPLAGPLETAVGDYAYLAICESCPYPLNFPMDLLQSAEGDEQIRDAFAWPIPTWKDDRWPVSVLDFYPRTDSPYPIPPLAPGLGYLKFINVMYSFLANRISTTCRDFLAVAKHFAQDIREKFQDGGDLTILEVPQIAGNMDQLIKWLQQPQVNTDVWTILEKTFELFDKATGLTPLLYAMNAGAADRSAEATAQKRQALDTRPQDMAKQVESWMADAAGLEAFCARRFITGPDVVGLLGRPGAFLWDQKVASQDEESVLRQFRYTIAAGSTRPPNKDRDVANANIGMQVWVPISAQFAAGTGNYGPLNFWLSKWGKANDEDVGPGLFNPPPPDPNAPNPAQAEAEAKRAESQQKLEAKREEHGMKMQQKNEEHQMDVQLKQHDQQVDAQVKQHEAAMQMDANRMRMDAQRTMFHTFGPLGAQMGGMQ